MARRLRLTPPGIPLHVTQRGNFRQDTFITDHDRAFFLHLLSELAPLRRVEVSAFCLMSNHFHLLLTPEDESGVSLLMQSLESTYSRRFNARLGRTGHLWQARFDSCTMDSTHFSLALAYVDLNPVRAGLVREATDYPWSSARTHCGLQPPASFHSLRALQDRWPTGGYADWLRQLVLTPEQLAQIRHASRHNLPWAAPAFVKDLEDRLGRSLQRRGPGRPCKLARAA